MRFETSFHILQLHEQAASDVSVVLIARVDLHTAGVTDEGPAFD